MLPLAVSALEALQDLPPGTWLKIGLGVAVLVAAVFLVRHLARMNKIVVGVVLVVAGSVVFFSWVYNRNEPRFLTPLVEKIAPFFPTAKVRQEKKWQEPGDRR